jgi:thiamine-phosphate pyrophosphorylase
MTIIPLDRFYPILDSYNWMQRLVPLGIKLVQLRIKSDDQQLIRDTILKCQALCQNHHCMLIINDHWQLAIDLGCDFVHLGQDDLKTADISALKKRQINLGISTHNHEELDHALSFDPDYIALGPIYPTLLKKMPWAPQGLVRIKEWKRIIGNMPLVAIGGLTIDRLQGVFDAGAASAAVITDIVTHNAPEQHTQSWMAAIKTIDQKHSADNSD